MTPHVLLFLWSAFALFAAGYCFDSMKPKLLFKKGWRRFFFVLSYGVSWAIILFLFWPFFLGNEMRS